MSRYGEYVPGVGLQGGGLQGGGLQHGGYGGGGYDGGGGQGGYDGQQGYYDQYGGGVEEAALPPPPEEGVWALQCCSGYEQSKVTCLEYDDYNERLWVGQNSGRVTSLVFVEDPVTGMMAGDRYSSFLASKEAVVKVIPQGQFLLTLNHSCIKMHTDGGLPLGNIDAPQSIDAGGAATFTCGSLVHRGQQGPHILTGTSHTYALLYDLQSLSSSPVLTYDVTVASCCMAVSSMHVIVAGQDGKLRLLDGRLRSSTVQHTLEAHSGPVHDVCVSPDGMTMVTCGAIGRPSTVQQNRMTHDPLVRIFDLRTNRQLPPVTMTTGSPHTLRFLTPPDLSSVAPNPYNNNTRLLMGASGGLIQISDPSPAADPSHTQILYAPFADQRESLTAAATSSSGQLVAIGTSLGMIAQFAVGLQSPSDKPKVNTMSAELQMPTQGPSQPVPSPYPLSYPLPVDAPVLGTAFCVNPARAPSDPQQQYEEPLLSSYATTPKFFRRKLRLGSARKISSDLLQHLVTKDFIGFVPNPGFPLNGLLATAPVNGKRAYAVADPRKLAEGGGGNGGGVGNGGGGGGGGNGTGGGGGASGDYWDGSSRGGGGDGNSSANFPVNPAIPATYRKQQSHRGKLRINAFNYGQHNSTAFVGLENSMPNAYTNPILQLLNFLPEVVVVASAAQTSHYHHHTPTSLWVELGFLFHMIRLVEKDGNTTDRVVTPANFQRTFQQVPEAVALGLFDGSQTNPQITVQTFIRFLLQQLHRESELETRPMSEARSVRSVGGIIQANRFYSAVDEIFGLTILSQTTFLSSRTTEVGAPIRAFTLDLVYPTPKVVAGIRSTSAAAAATATAAAAEKEKERLAAGDDTPSVSRMDHFIRREAKPGGANSPLSFAAVLWQSLRKEATMKGWCTASKSNEPCRQVRSVVSLPRILTILCGDTMRDPKDATVAGALGEATLHGSMHAQYWAALSHLGGPWLPIELEVAILETEPGQQSRLVVSALLQAPAAPEPEPPKPPQPATTTTTTGDAAAAAAPAPAPATAPTPTPLVGGKKAHEPVPLRWAIFDGIEDFVATVPASQLPQYDMASARSPPPSAPVFISGAVPPRPLGWEVVSFHLCAVVSEVVSSMPASASGAPATAATPRTASSSDLTAAMADLGGAGASAAAAAATAAAASAADKHVLLHLRKFPGAMAAAFLTSSATAEELGPEWMLFNDFALRGTDALDAVSFPAWKHPCSIFFARTDYHYSFPNKARGSNAATAAAAAAADGLPAGAHTTPDTTAVPSSVLGLPSLSSTPSVRLNATTLPGKGSLVAFDGEFVSVELERATVNAQGARVVAAEGRQVLARISLVEGGAVGVPLPADASPRVLVDDYIMPSEAVVDYVTRFSGIVAEDLQPAVSRHAVVTNRTAYLKLRFFVDRGCCLVGHGLQKDFETANIVVPREQVIDTVELWRLPGQRKISLRFLAAYLLEMDIQDEVHDSIEDAKTALALYRHYERVSAQGPAALNAVLQDLYNYGQRANWVIGSDRLR